MLHSEWYRNTLIKYKIIKWLRHLIWFWCFGSLFFKHFDGATDRDSPLGAEGQKERAGVGEMRWDDGGDAGGIGEELQDHVVAEEVDINIEGGEGVLLGGVQEQQLWTWTGQNATIKSASEYLTRQPSQGQSRVKTPSLKNAPRNWVSQRKKQRTITSC